MTPVPQLDVALAQPDVALAKPDITLAQPDVSLAQPDVSLAQPDVSLAQLDVPLAHLDLALTQSVYGTAVYMLSWVGTAGYTLGTACGHMITLLENIPDLPL